MANTEFHAENNRLLKSEVPVPGWWKSRVEDIQEFIDNKVKKGKVETISISPGGREVKAVFYGQAEPHLKGTANFNSAIGAQNPEAYYKRGNKHRKRPVMMLIAGIHGQEMECMVGTLSLLSIMEEGKDITGREQDELRRELECLRLIVVPLANPDGRARVPYDGWVGLPPQEMVKYGQGTYGNGEIIGYPACKAIHPVQGDIGILGGYYDDRGINIMHDEWSCPMSDTSRALLKLIREEGPDLAINMHGHGEDPSILPVDYVPMPIKLKSQDLANEFYRRVKERGYQTRELSFIRQEAPDDPPRSFNFTSFAYHTGAAVSITYESPHGFPPCSYIKMQYDYNDIIEIQHILFDVSCKILKSN